MLPCLLNVVLNALSVAQKRDVGGRKVLQGSSSKAAASLQMSYAHHQVGTLGRGKIPLLGAPYLQQKIEWKRLTLTLGPQFKASDSDLSVLLADHGKRAESSQAPSTPVGAEEPSGGALLSPGRLHSSTKRHTLREMTLEHEKIVATVKCFGK